ncbi:MAG TPA: GAF domain-containing protein [Terriglobales bacterium]|nr:GAF domain-containing protein [Terriglobales bacterium]
MDRNSIFDVGGTASAPGVAKAEELPSAPKSPPETKAGKVMFPGEDGGRSLNEMAQRDLDATLQLLAERAQYITGATGAAIALRSGAEIVCRASAGSSAPELGAHLQVESGLSGESIRTKQILRCNDAHTDPRVNRESCEALGIASVVVMPLVHEGDVNGVFELLSDRSFAFEERDIGALERLGEMVQTALEHAVAALTAAELGSVGGPEVESSKPNDVSATINQATESAARVVKVVTKEVPAAIDPTESRVDDEPILAELDADAMAAVFQGIEVTAKTSERKESEPTRGAMIEVPAEPTPTTGPQASTGVTPSSSEPPTSVLSLRKCSECGFPISEGRKVCLDCEKKLKASDGTMPAGTGANEAVFFTMEAGGEGLSQDESWLARHRVLVAILVVVSLVLIGIILLR